MKFTPLTPAQRQAFNDDGFLVVRNALTPQQIERVIAAGDRLIHSDRTENRQTMSGSYDSFRNCVSMDDTFLELLTLETTVPLAVQLLGPRIQCVTSHLIYKSPNEPGTPPEFRQPNWHRDLHPSPLDLGHAHTPRLELKIAYYLTDVSQPNSAVTLFARGSNHLKDDLRRDGGDPEGVVEPSLQPGDAVFFENRTWHAGAPNLTAQTTKAIMMGYGFWWIKPMDYLVQSDEVLDKVDDIGKQLLGGLSGPEGRFVPGGVHTPLVDWCRTHDVTYQPVDF